ncbi:nuclease-related domain-containing protein [Peribacillus psychrosaccharolyticus]|uniref:nuclease-related domain-containing protein n=1 Tax=Peribacillus psychrosaccharolyticus TaxID=1407 RepID=UPI003D2A35DF
MFIKPIKPPLSIQVLEALVRRLSPKHPRIDEIKEELRITKAGYRGEQSLDYFLGALSSKKYTIFHDLRLPYTPNTEPYYFQIDILLVCSTHLLMFRSQKLCRYTILRS